MRRLSLLYFLLSALMPVTMLGQGSVIVRVDDHVDAHCIDATAEQVTIHVRRRFIEKSNGLFTDDNRAAVFVAAKLTATSPNTGNTDLQIPSVNLVRIIGEKSGRVSLPLEYPIASYFPLQQDETTTTGIQMSISLSKTRAKNSFGDVIDVAGKVLNKLPVPNNNTYVQGLNIFLQFANDAITSTTTGSSNVPFAEVSLAFNKGKESDLPKCKSEGKERTGAIAALLSTGVPNSQLIPTTDTDQLYCFTYSSNNTYES